MSQQLHIPLRHIQRKKRLGINESEFQPTEELLRFPLKHCALVLVDVWDQHHITSHQQRCEAITQAVIAPLLHHARQAGLTVIHAPGPDIAVKYPQCPTIDPSRGDQWLGMTTSDWPPADYQQRSGDYAALWPATDSSLPEDVARLRTTRQIAPALEPFANEAVIATGQQLATELAAHDKLLIFYAGFAANICLLFRDYGMRAMRGHGYDVALVRDATTAIEVAATYKNETLLQAAIADVEMNLGYSICSNDLIAALLDK